jgi:uroporphyrinogen decarboxylase
MTSYERVMTAMECGQPDRVPILEWVIHPKVMQRICPGAATQADFEEQMGFDAVCAGHTFLKVRENEDGTYYDEWGVRYAPSSEMQDHPVEAPIRTLDDLRRYVPPEPDAAHRLGALPELVKRFKGEKAIVFLQRAAFMHSVSLRGFEDLLVDFLAAPEFACAVMDVVLKTNMKLARNAVRAGADIIVLADDYAGNDTTFFSPAVFEKFVRPRLKRMVDAIHEEGAKVVKHSDGNLWPVLDRIVDTGIDGINPLEPVAGMDIGEVKQKYGDRVCLVGNIDCSHILSEATPDEVVRAVAECIRKGSPRGGHIIASSNCIHSAVKPENYLAMIRATKEFGGYPISSPAWSGATHE